MGRKKEPSLEEIRMVAEKERYVKLLADIILEENTIPTPRQIDEYTDYWEMERVSDYDKIIPAARKELKARGVPVDSFGRAKDETARLRHRKNLKKRLCRVQFGGNPDSGVGTVRKGKNVVKKEELTVLLKDFYKKELRLPTSKEIAKMEGWPNSSQAVSYHLGRKDEWYKIIGVPNPEKI